MKKKVRIYKAPDNKGKYINKTKKYLSKYQLGGSTSEGQLMEMYKKNVFSQLRSNMEPEDVYMNLITSGLDKQTAGAIMTQVISEMIQAGMFDPQYFEKLAKQAKENQPEQGQMPQTEMTDLAQSEEPYQEDAYAQGDEEEMMAEDQTGQLSMAEGGDIEKCPEGKYWNGRYCAPIKIVTEEGKKIKVVPTALEMENPNDHPYNIGLQRVSTIDEILKRQEEKGWDDDITNKMICQDGSCHAVMIDDDTPIEDYVPPGNRTYDEIYPEVDHNKYPTIDDFIFAAEYYKDEGENPPDDLLPSNRKKVVDIEQEVIEPPEDREPEIEINPLPIVSPGLLSNDTEIPELEEREEVEGIDYKRKFGVWLEDKATKKAKLKTFFKYTLPEFFNDKPSRNTWYYRTPKRIRAGFYNKPIEDEQMYPEGYVPMFQEGGAMDEQGNMLEQQENIIPFDQYVDSMNPTFDDLKFPSLSEYLTYNEPSYEDMSQMKNGGMTKRKFVKSLLKKQEGGDTDEQPIGAGDREDTLTHEVQKRKSDFTSTLKQLNTKALGESIYENAMKLGDPKVMEMAEGLVQKQPEMPMAQKGLIVGAKELSSIYPDLRPITDFTKLSKDKLKQLSQIRGLISGSTYANTANDRTLKKLLNSAATSHVTDADLQILFPGTQGKESILNRIAQGRGPLQSKAADLTEAASYGETPRLLTQDDAASLGQGNIRYEMMGPTEDRINSELMFERMLANPFSRPFQGQMGLAESGIGSATLIPSLYAKDFYDKGAMLAATKAQANQIANLPIGAVGTGSDNVTIDSKLMQDSMFGKIMADPEAYGVFGSPLFTGYGRLAGDDFLTKGYWSKKMQKKLDELEYLGLRPEEKVRKAQEIMADMQRIRRDYYMTHKGILDQRYDTESMFPILEYKPESALTRATEYDDPFSEVNVNWGLGGRFGKLGYDWVVPHYGLGKTKNVENPFMAGGFVDGEEPMINLQEGAEFSESNVLPMAQRGGAAYRVARAFANAADDEADAQANADDDTPWWEGYEVRDATPVYNRRTVPYGTFSRRGLGLRDLLFPANRMFGRGVKYGKARYLDGSQYMGPGTDLTPYKTEVTKTGLFGRPKKFTHYYTQGDQSDLQKDIDARNEATRETIKLDPKNAYADLKGSTRRGILRAERKVEREDKRAARNPEGNVPGIFNPFNKAARQAKRKAEFGGYLPEAKYGFANNMGVNLNMPEFTPDPANEVGGLDMSGGFGDMSNTFMNVNTPTIDPNTQPNNINVDPNQPVDPIQENPNDFIYGNDAKKKGKQVTIKGKMRTRVTDGEALANTAIAGIRGIAGLKNRFNTRDNYADYQDEMTRPEALYANTVKTYKGEEADVAGKQLGLKRFDEMGQMDYTGTNTAKYGRFMQEGGLIDSLLEDEEYELPEELIEYLIANGVELDFM